MADLAESAVVVNDTWKEGGTNARKFLAKDVTLTLTGQGTTTNKIPAALFGMTRIISVRDARVDGNVPVTAVPDYAGDNILLAPLQWGLSGNAETISNAPVDLTDTIRLTVLGYDT